MENLPVCWVILDDLEQAVGHDLKAIESATCTKASRPAYLHYFCHVALGLNFEAGLNTRFICDRNDNFMSEINMSNVALHSVRFSHAFLNVSFRPLRYSNDAL